MLRCPSAGSGATDTWVMLDPAAAAELGERPSR